MKSQPGNVLVWGVVGIAILIAFYVLGTLLLQAKKQSSPIPSQDLETERSL